MKQKTIAIDFDGVIHKYSKGWQNGECYDGPVEGVFEAISALIVLGHSVFIFSTRDAKQIVRWMKKHTYMTAYEKFGPGDDNISHVYPRFNFTVERIPFWKKFWNKKGVIGVTKRKLPAASYIDDRAINFNGDWYDTIAKIQNFKTYQGAA